MPRPRVVSVKIKELRKRNYASLEEWLAEPKHLYIGRTVPWVKSAKRSLWANPYPVSKHGLANSLKFFREHVQAHLMDRIHELGQYTELGCWCHPNPCHGDVLLELYNEYCKKK